MSNIAIVVAASVATFRRAGIGFTDKGTAFAAGQLSDEQLEAIKKEPRLSLTQMSPEEVPETVDRAPLDKALSDAALAATAAESDAAETASQTGNGG